MLLKGMTSGNRPKLFGTDGIRARFGKFPLDQKALHCLGSALADLWQGKEILIGRDTRESGSHIERVIAARISDKAGIHSCGVFPTPGLAYLTGLSGFDYGIMITASHNSYHDNGIKIFRENGEKVSAETENRIENAFYTRYENRALGQESGGEEQRTEICSANGEGYRHFLQDQAVDLEELKLKCILDCAQGATFEIAPAIFANTGLDVIPINIQPDGLNINDGCGSTDLSRLKSRVRSENAGLGIAFDGDGDRVIFVDNGGYQLDGDYALVLISDLLLRTNPDFNKTVVGTVMSNLGLEMALKERGIELVRTGVGDRLVYQEMKKRDAVLGGEQSGHIIVRDFQSTGDGILTALLFLKALKILGLNIGDLRNLIVSQPQVIKNIPVKEKPELQNWDELNQLTDKFNGQFGDHSRLVIRYSGTEPKIRIMMESRHEQIITDNINKFVDLIRSQIGE